MLKDKLRNRELTFGSWLTIGHQSIVEIMASAGFEWLTIDMEHSAIELSEAQNLIGHIQGNGMEALVRVGRNDEVLIKRVMDAGADGVIVPMVNTVEDARSAVERVKYPPVGKRGVGLARAQKYGIGFEAYKNWLEERSVVIAQIEHIDAVENLDGILGVEGIDGIIVGPYDLSGSMGKPGRFEDDDVKAALSRVIDVCSRGNKSMGFHVIRPEVADVRQKMEEGYTFVAVSLDFFFLGDKARQLMAALTNQ